MKYPSEDVVRLIFKDTYNFYLKWIAVNEVDWQQVIEEARELEIKYPFDLCKKMIVELVTTIEAEKMGKS